MKQKRDLPALLGVEIEKALQSGKPFRIIIEGKQSKINKMLVDKRVTCQLEKKIEVWESLDILGG